jgi:ubiquinone/menaquinone biosynthesis C-methylase UbiE
MSNPWLEIPLKDYEEHMALPSIGQAEMLADQFALLIKRIRPASVSLVGCAGGNGLERIDPDRVERVVAVDINSKYVEEARARHAKRLKHLQLICADIQSEELQFEPVDFIYAALVFEYVDVLSTIATLKRICRGGGTLATVLQLPSSRQSTVSPSPYESLSRLAAFMSLVAPSDLSKIAVAGGFTPATSEIIELPSGKSFCIQTFRAEPR